jgi:hypothetical protein
MTTKSLIVLAALSLFACASSPDPDQVRIMNAAYSLVAQERPLVPLLEVAILARARSTRQTSVDLTRW